MLLLPYWQPQVSGLEHFPGEGAAILVANHPTLMDPFLVAAVTPRKLDFLIRHEVLRIPILGFLIGRSGGITVRPGSSTLHKALERLSQGRAVAVFPEAYQTHSHQLQLLRKGAAALAVRSGAPVIPLGLSGPEYLSTARGAWVEGGRVSLRFGPPLRAHSGETAEEFGKRLRAALEALISGQPPLPPKKHWKFRLAQAVWVPTTWLIFKLADWWNPHNRR